MGCYYHYAELIPRQAEKYGNRTALRYRDDASGRWLKVSWNDFAEKVRLTATAMAEFGMEVQENIGVYSQNMPQCLYTYFGAYANRLADVPMYATSSPEQIAFIVKDANIHTLFVGEQQQYNNAWIVMKQLPNILKRLVIYDPAVKLNPEDKQSIYFEDFIRLGDNAHAASTVKIRTSQAVPEDIATIIYTSGTTGHSKGVVLTHANYLEAMRTHDLRIPQVTDKDLSMCFLPLTHIFERGWTMVCLMKGTQVAVNRDPKRIQKSLKEVCPTVMCSVPRFWEKVYIAVKAKMDDAGPLQKKLFYHALAVGKKRNIDYIANGKRPPLALELEYKIINKTILSIVRKQLGLDNPNIFPTAGAYVSPEVEEFVHSVGINMVVGYGLTESLATVSCDHLDKKHSLGSVGRPISSIQIKIGEDNEIL